MNVSDPLLEPRRCGRPRVGAGKPSCHRRRGKLVRRAISRGGGARVQRRPATLLGPNGPAGGRPGPQPRCARWSNHGAGGAVRPAATRERAGIPDRQEPVSARHPGPRTGGRVDAGAQRHRQVGRDLELRAVSTVGGDREETTCPHRDRGRHREGRRPARGDPGAGRPHRSVRGLHVPRSVRSGRVPRHALRRRAFVLAAAVRSAPTSPTSVH